MVFAAVWCCRKYIETAYVILWKIQSCELLLNIQVFTSSFFGLFCPLVFVLRRSVTAAFLKLIVLVLVELIIFLVADTVLCSGFRMRIMMGTQQYFDCCWVQIQGYFSFLSYPDSEGLGVTRGWEMAQTAQLTPLAKAQGTESQKMWQKNHFCVMPVLSLIGSMSSDFAWSLFHVSCMCLYPQEDFL